MGGRPQGTPGQTDSLLYRRPPASDLNADRSIPDEPQSRRSPLYEARHASWYERQSLIQEYEKAQGCRLVVVIDLLFASSVTLFEETLYDADPKEDLHVMLTTPGGDGETALRLVRQAQSRCAELTVIVPVQAKSAGTLFVLGADHIYLGPTSDLGPVDPQLQFPNRQPAAAKAIIAAVDEAERRIKDHPETYPLHISMLGDVTALMVQQARNALARANDQLREALASASHREAPEVKELASKLHAPLIAETQSHGTTISAQHAKAFGLPVREADPAEPQWQAIWRLWTKYALLNAARVYESRHTSSVVPLNPAP